MIPPLVVKYMTRTVVTTIATGLALRILDCNATVLAGAVNASAERITMPMLKLTTQSVNTPERKRNKVVGMDTLQIGFTGSGSYRQPPAHGQQLLQ
jgi:hypothetical protein